MRKKKFETEEAYYSYHINKMAPYYERKDIENVIAAMYQVAEQIYYKYDLDDKSVIDAWHDELINGIMKLVSIEEEHINHILYLYAITNEYCGFYDHPKRKNFKVNPNVSKTRFMNFYSKRIQNITCFNMTDVKKVLTIYTELPANDRLENPIGAISFISGLDIATVRTIMYIWDVVTELCGYP